MNKPLIAVLSTTLGVAGLAGCKSSSVDDDRYPYNTEAGNTTGTPMGDRMGRYPSGSPSTNDPTVSPAGGRNISTEPRTSTVPPTVDTEPGPNVRLEPRAGDEPPLRDPVPPTIPPPPVVPEVPR